MVRQRLFRLRHTGGYLLRLKAVGVFMSNYRLLFMAIAVIAVLSIMLVSGAVRGTMVRKESSETSGQSNGVRGNSVLTIFSNNSSKNNSQDARSDTKIYVNNHKLDIPDKGSLSKTFVDQNGTTHVNVQRHSSEQVSGTSVSTTTRVNVGTEPINK